MTLKLQLIVRARLAACMVVGTLHVEGIFCYARCLLAWPAWHSFTARSLKHRQNRPRGTVDLAVSTHEARAGHEVEKIPYFSVPAWIVLSQRMREAATTKRARLHAAKPHQPPCRRPNYMRTMFFAPFFLNQALVSLARSPHAAWPNCCSLPNSSLMLTFILSCPDELSYYLS